MLPSLSSVSEEGDDLALFGVRPEERAEVVEEGPVEPPILTSAYDRVIGK
jgi:hypothetical protein